ncbi:nitrate ABC transporter ATP-binding protein [Sulfuriferula plumbiphila]|uniref:Nitrate ABC transporter ATP-binding protein n=1 Tax=Sulfuriferula plumbiphila TaxID=171865 RepID=A0A512L9T0_9PROT|nr:ABC transporter ATP-binding protein [Sulfuriferula plumbiphila]BBP03735.1 nitrate ABC transporter ATP-binding protein [Sulfuriferula plumbiphila]GEP31244.1 nitrate ABC transporter ATP-binding protein [Sulfuriferula plumbiphila]
MAIRGVQIKIKGLTHRYSPRGAVTFNRVDLEAQPGEALAIIGRSGCGKSTLLHIVAGLLRPTEGTIHLDGTLVEGPSPRWVMMFQAPHLFPWMKVAQNVGVGLRFGRWSKNEIRERVAEALRLVELQDFAESNVQDLSGGQQQRVALARSLVMEPELLLLDEPFSALDAFTRSSLQRDVRSIAKRLGINLVIVTHDIDEAVLMADRALIMAGSPGNIVHELEVDLPDPRERQDPAVQALRASLMATFQGAANLKPGTSGAGTGNGSVSKTESFSIH